VRVVAIIPAKGNSERLPEKNIYPIWGKPMLYWAIKACQDSKYNIIPWVATDSEKVANIASQYGAKIYKRDPGLSEPTVYKQAVIRSAASFIINNDLKWSDVFISLQPNSPQITEKDLDKGIDTLLNYQRDEVFSVDTNLMQNAAFRIFKGKYVFQRDLSTNCGVVVCDLHDVHTIEDVNYLEKINEQK
tara:strand:- start:147 stop:713 length:567 start_codon:yes stop_codon:yes gene_type:complete